MTDSGLRTVLVLPRSLALNQAVWTPGVREEITRGANRVPRYAVIN